MGWDRDPDHEPEPPDAKRCYECDTLVSPSARSPYYCSRKCREANQQEPPEPDPALEPDRPHPHVLTWPEPEKETRVSTAAGLVVEFALLPRGSWRAKVGGSELDVWPLGGGVWRWSTLGPDGRYTGGGDRPSWEEAAAAAEACTRPEPHP